MRKIFEAYNYDVSNVFLLPDDEESGAAYGMYIQNSKEYKELVKLMKKYRMEGDDTYRITMGSGHFRARFKCPFGIIDMDETGYTFSPKSALRILNESEIEKYAKAFADIKSFCDAVLKVGLDDMDSPLGY